MTRAASRYRIEDLLLFTEAVLRHYGVAEDHARTTATRMLEADVQGKSGHGIFRLPAYARRLAASGYNLTPNVTITNETAVSALVDGDNALGQVVMTTAVEVAMKKARQNGLSWVGVRRSNHAGAGGVYAAMALADDLIGVYFAVGNANHLPPWGGSDRLLSTNPVAVAIPAGREPALVLDMATTVVSYGRIKLAAQRGESMPEGWMVDRNGDPLTDPARSDEGFLLPIGGYKGYGLNLVIGALAGILNGAAIGSTTIDFNTDYGTPTNTGQAILVLRPDLFIPLPQFRLAMDSWIREIRLSHPANPLDPIRTPGDQLRQRSARVRDVGLEIDTAIVQELIELAKRMKINDHPFVDEGIGATPVEEPGRSSLPDQKDTK